MRINEVHFHVFIFSAVKEVIYMAQPLTSFHSSLICAIRNSIIAVDVINKTFAYEYRFQYYSTVSFFCFVLLITRLIFNRA